MMGCGGSGGVSPILQRDIESVGFDLLAGTTEVRIGDKGIIEQWHCCPRGFYCGSCRGSVILKKMKKSHI
jgi:hypothetical protein